MDNLQNPGPIVLLTDFGNSDPFVGQMKGVITGINPDVAIIDLCHDVPPQNITVGSIFLRGSDRFFPDGTIFIAVIDPTVGTDRKAVIVKARNKYFIGPDNGLIWITTQSDLGGEDEWEAVTIENPDLMLPVISDTFHGRDIFAPAAAHLSKGVEMSDFGGKLESLVTTDIPLCFVEDDIIRARIIHIDHYGNAWTNVHTWDLKEFGWDDKRDKIGIKLASTKINGIQSSYLAAKKNKPVAMINSFNLVEIAWPGDSAEKRLRLWEGIWVDMELND